jgi:antitoxin MazE
MVATVRIQKWGNNLGINIPSVIANGLSLKEDLYVSVQEDGYRMIVEPFKPNVSYNLTDMLSEITEDNVHNCIETGMPIGNEIW